MEHVNGQALTTQASRDLLANSNMVLKLFSASFPGAGGGIVALVLAEKQIPFEHVLIDLKAKEQKTPEFLAMNPFGQVPVIVSNMSLYPSTH
jgi:glutathione S-transferase